MTQPTRNLNVTPAEVARNGQAPAYVDLAIAQAELTRTSYALQTQYTGLLREITLFLCRSPQPHENGCDAPVRHAEPHATFSEHALVIRQMSEELSGLADEIATCEWALAEVRTELAKLGEGEMSE